MLDLEVSFDASQDLDDVFAYSVERYGDAQAAKYTAAIEATFKRLCEFPKIGSIHRERDGLRSIGSGRHRIYYHVDRKRIRIVRILHQTMLSQGRLPD